ncbi:antibiotic biosynthesis monooxygenase [Acidaminobacter sp. JC074]|uniref:putative quinol monooxygenase n=1 Tax=Acidaminobacter sp. JC074 TaxID=2530199 RepID=UPI001F0D75AB|nr:putative quinol monooxygenase [Acidaminobacter sp. JC074]MCH4889243.1 antibiotic biosynthesis monooxygenase [Acidaminobacter sp. JC074]
MIKVVAKNWIKEAYMQDLLDLCKELIEVTHKEKGCISYEMYQDESDECILTMIETWASKEDLDSHLQSDHFKRLAPKFANMLKRETEMNIYTKIL